MQIMQLDLLCVASGTQSLEEVAQPKRLDLCPHGNQSLMFITV